MRNAEFDVCALSWIPVVRPNKLNSEFRIHHSELRNEVLVMLLTTPRLVLREMTEDDFDALQEFVYSTVPEA